MFKDPAHLSNLTACVLIIYTIPRARVSKISKICMVLQTIKQDSYPYKLVDKFQNGGQFPMF